MRCGAPLQQSVGESAAAPAGGYSAPGPATPGHDSYGAPVYGEPEYSGFWRRFLAAFIDGIITQIVSLIPAFIIGIAIGIGGAASGADNEMIEALGGLMGAVVGLAIGWLYEAVLTSSAKQATLGKMAMGIIVTDMEGNRLSFARATGRYFGKIVSALTLLIGYLIQPFTAKRQALHDLLAGTLVVKKVQS